MGIHETSILTPQIGRLVDFQQWAGGTAKSSSRLARSLPFPALSRAVYFVVPRVPSFRELTNTVGVNYKSLTYARWCTEEGALQVAADTIDSLGLNASAEGSSTGQTFVLRAAEAVDSIANAAKSGATEDPYASAGYALCTIVQLGGLIYVLFCLLLAFIFLSFLPCANFVFAVFFDFFTAISPATGPTTSQARTKAKQITELLPPAQTRPLRRGRFARLQERMQGFGVQARAFRNPFRISSEAYKPVRAVSEDLP